MNKIVHPIEPEELMAYLDGELPGDRAAVAAVHVNECAECQGVVAELRGVSQELKSWEVERAESTTPPAIAAALHQSSLETRKASSTRKVAWREVFSVRWGFAEWAGLLALVSVVIIGTVRLIGGNANNAFSQVSSQLDGSGQGEQPGAQATLRSERPAPKSTDIAGGVRDKLALELMPSESASQGGGGGNSNRLARRETNIPSVSGPMVIRTAQLALITKDFDNARSALEAILKRHRGYVGELKVGGSTGSGRTLAATLRVPADQLDASLTDLKTLGRVESESQSGQDVTSQYVDLQARLANARNTEQRLTDLLRQRTGKLSDVLEVEQEVDRVRGEIEQMEAERKNMSNQVSFATLNATITEDYKAQLQVVPPSTSTRLSNAAVEGYKSMVDGMVGLALFLLENIPSLLFWLAIFFLPARLVWKKVRRSFAQ
jgi:Flp pilus assembly pilin Flp